MLKKEINEETLDEILNILNSNKTDNEKAKECQILLSYSELYRVKRSNTVTDESILKKLDKIFLRYKYFKASGAFYQKSKNNLSGYEQLKVKEEFDNIYDVISNEDIHRIDKILLLLEKYPNRTSLNKKYTSLIRRAKDMIDTKYIKISVFYDSITKHDRELCKKIVENGIKVDQDYADYIVRTFLDLIDTNTKTDILLKLEITEIEFECLVAISSKEVQEEFDNYMNSNRERLIKDTLDRLKYINENILMHKDFNLLEFYRLIPFKEYGKDFPSRLLIFIHKHSKSTSLYAAYEDYLFRYSINEIHIIDEGELLNNSNNIDETNTILNYMKTNNYPMIIEIYNLLLMKNRYDGLDNKGLK